MYMVKFVRSNLLNVSIFYYCMHAGTEIIYYRL